MKKYRLFSRLAYVPFLILCLLAIKPVWADVSSRVSSNPVYAGEIFSLTISREGGGRVAAPDLSPLAKDFTVLGQSQQSQTQIINGQRSDKMQWIIQLMAKQSGQLTIPALSVGNAMTAAIDIEVLQAETRPKDGDTRTAFIEISVDNQTPYVQSQLIYTVKLFFARALSRGELSNPVAEDVLMFPLGEDRQYQARRDGVMYQVVERRYAMFPQRSGDLSIQSPIFRGIVLENNTANQDPFFPSLFGRSQPIQLTAAEQVLNVQAIPNAAQGSHWFPAEDVQLSEQWQGVDDELKVGAPITRTISLRATSTMVALLPQLPNTEVSGMNSYPKTERSTNQLLQGRLVAERVDNLVYIPNQAGEYQLPAVNLTWWDTTQNRLRTASLPAKTIQVAAAGAIATPTPTAPVSVDMPASQAVIASDAPTRHWLDYLPWIVAALCLLLWLVTLFWGRLPQLNAKTTRVKPTEKSLLAAIKVACEANDAQTAARLLLQWANCKWRQQSFHHINDLTTCIDDGPLLAALNELTTALYAASKETSWQGHILWQALQQFQPARQSRKRAKTDLPQLYPQ